jgi:hypothetical protein
MTEAIITVTFQCKIEDGEDIDTTIINYREAIAALTGDFAFNHQATGSIINQAPKPEELIDCGCGMGNDCMCARTPKPEGESDASV